MVVLEIVNVSFKYNSIKALDNVSFKIDYGELTTILGPNGSGKTTLLKCMCGILRKYLGKIIILGKNISTYNRIELAKIIGYVPQLNEKPFPLTVYEWILLGRKPYMGFIPKQRDYEVVEKIINILKIDHLKFRKVTELSGGEWRIVELARALAQEPKALLLDEPTNHLDFKNQILVLNLLKKLVRSYKIVILMTTHDINQALWFSDKVILLKNGRIQFCGKTNMLNSAIIKEVYNMNIELVRIKDKVIALPQTA